MKKVISLLVVMVVAISICSCGKGDSKGSKVTLRRNNGVDVEMTLDDLKKAYIENNAQFKKLYEGAKVSSFTGTVKSVREKPCAIQGINGDSPVDRIEFTNGWNFYTDSTYRNEFSIADINAGDKLTIEDAEIHHGPDVIIMYGEFQKVKQVQ